MIERLPEPEFSPVNRALARVYLLNWEALVYIVIFVLAIFTRFYILGDRVMSHDESLHTKFSYDLYSQGVYQHTPLMHGPILFHATALMYTLFGDNDFTARIYTAVLGIGMVMMPLLFRRWLGRWGAILTSIMMLVSPLLLYYNRYIREDTPSIFYTLVMVYCTFMYLDGPQGQRRRARWLYIFAAAMLASMGSKEVSFIYVAVFGSFLTLYWLVRLGQHFFRLPGKSLMYFLSMAVLLAGVAALGMYVVLSVAPLDTVLPQGTGSADFASLITWTVVVFGAAALMMFGTLLWAYRSGQVRIPWLEVGLLIALIMIVCAFFIYIEERSHVQAVNAAQTAAPPVPGQVEAVRLGTGFNPLPIILMWALAAVIIALLIYSRQAGWWRTLHRFPEFDILLLMGTLILPWLMPFVTAFTGVTPADYAAIGQSAPEFIRNLVPIQSPEAVGKTVLAILAIIPAFAIAIVAGLTWNAKRWAIASAVYHVIYVFFFTTVFTNMAGLAGLYTSLDYWLEQQAVRRGNQPQYYYLVIILPFYEFLPIIGSILAMLAGTHYFWRFRRDRAEERQMAWSGFADQGGGSADNLEMVEPVEETPPLTAVLGQPKRKRGVPDVDYITRVPFLLFVSWWAIFNMIAYTLAGEKMPWLGTHMTTPMIFLAGWYFGRLVDRVQLPGFLRWGWLTLLLLPVLFVALMQIFGPFLVGPVLGGLTQDQLSRTYQWLAGIVIAGVVLYVLYGLIGRIGWQQFRLLLGVAIFISLTFITFRSAWMASFINYDLATEYLVYAHGAPANKRVTEQLEEMSKRITDGRDIRFAYDFKISWPGAWYFRDFPNAIFLGESPTPRQMEDAVVVIVGDENRAAVEAALEDRYYRFSYIRLWWPMQDYFNLTPQRVINTFDLSPQNVQAQQIRRGIFDIWWWRDYTTFGEATGKNFNVTEWPVADRMYVFVRKDIAAQIWSLGVGDGSALNPLAQTEVNLCTQNWQPLNANLVMGGVGSNLGQLNTPRQVAVGPDGRIYVAEEFNHRVSVFNRDGSFAFSFGQSGRLYQEGDPFFGLPAQDPQTGGAFDRPSGVGVGLDGRIYVADTWNYRVQVFDATGGFLSTWGQRGELGIAAGPVPNDALWGPRALAIDSEGRVYVADTGNKRVRVYSSDGRYLRDIGSGGGGNGQLDEPVGLAISPSGILYVADTWNRRISAFTLDGTPANIFVSADGQPVNNFRVRAWFDDLGNRPYLAIDDQRSLLYVTDPDAGRVMVYDTLGNCVGSFGQLNRENFGPSEFVSVAGVTVDAQGMVYVADSGSSRILRFDPFPLPPGPVAPALNPIEVTPEMTAEILPEVTAEATPEVAPTSQGGVMLEITPEVTPEVTAEVTVETTQQVTGEISPETTPPPAP